MIHPIPAGVEPNTHTCGCGGRFTMPGMFSDAAALRCVVDPDHETYMEKNNGRTKFLHDPVRGKVEVDVLTQQEIGGEITPIKDEATALVQVKKAVSLGLWKDKSTPAQELLLAHVAYHYQMDVIMGEIMPYQGKPFITIKGRRRYDRREGHRGGITFRNATEDEWRGWLEMKSVGDKDVIQVAILTEPDGVVSEGIGRVMWSEDVNVTGAARTFLPIIIRKVEMAQKRAESRVREMVFGAIGKPAELRPEAFALQEHDESLIVHGTARVLPESEELELPDLGECPEHGVQFEAQWDKYKKPANTRPRGFHFITEGVPCVLGTVYQPIFMGHWAAKFGEPVKKDVDTWLKENFKGTWSMMDSVQQLQAVNQMRVDTETGEVEQPPEDTVDADYVAMPGEDVDQEDAVTA